MPQQVLPTPQGSAGALVQFEDNWRPRRPCKVGRLAVYFALTRPVVAGSGPRAIGASGGKRSAWPCALDFNWGFKDCRSARSLRMHPFPSRPAAHRKLVQQQIFTNVTSQQRYREHLIIARNVTKSSFTSQL